MKDLNYRKACWHALLFGFAFFLFDFYVLGPMNEFRTALDFFIMASAMSVITFIFEIMKMRLDIKKEIDEFEDMEQFDEEDPDYY